MISLTKLKKPIYSLKTPMVSYKFLAINSLRGKPLNALICRSYKFLQIYKVANTSFVVYIMLWDCRMQNWEAIPILTLLSNPSWLEFRTNSAPSLLQMLLVNFWVQFVHREETCHNQLWKQRSVSIWAFTRHQYGLSPSLSSSLWECQTEMTLCDPMLWEMKRKMFSFFLKW